MVYGFRPTHLQHLKCYESAWRERQHLLQTAPVERDWLKALEEQIARHAVAVGAARLAVLEDMSQACAERYSGFPRARLWCDGQVETELREKTAEQVVERQIHILEKSRRPADDGLSALPRCDFKALHVDKDMDAAFCSTGEQKALLVSIVLANARLLSRRMGKVPLLLLDEVTAHFDSLRTDALFDELLALKAQAWMTGTCRAFFQSIETMAHFEEMDGYAAMRPEEKGGLTSSGFE
jgi:DNA replication and repair protein RecF